MGQAFDDGGLTDASFADEYRVILRPAAENLHHPADFFLSTDDRVEFAGPGHLGEVAAKSLQQRETLAPTGAAPFFAGATRRRRIFAIGLLLRRSVFRLTFTLNGSVGVDVGEDFFAATLEVDVELLEDTGSDALPFLQEPQQDMFGANVGMTEATGFRHGMSHDLLHARCERNGVRSLSFLRPLADLLLDGRADTLQIEAHPAEDIDGHAFTQLDQAEQDVLRANVVVVESARFGPGELHDLTGAGREIVVILVLVHGMGGGVGLRAC